MNAQDNYGCSWPYLTMTQQTYVHANSRAALASLSNASHIYSCLTVVLWNEDDRTTWSKAGCKHILPASVNSVICSRIIIFRDFKLKQNVDIGGSSQHLRRHVRNQRWNICHCAATAAVLLFNLPWQQYETMKTLVARHQWSALVYRIQSCTVSGLSHLNLTVVWAVCVSVNMPCKSRCSPLVFL